MGIVLIIGIILEGIPRGNLRPILLKLRIGLLFYENLK